MTKRSGILFCLVGPAGGGKTTLSERLLREFHGSISRSVSVTTRKPRAAEQHGLSYFFTTEEDFQGKISRQEFFEWEEIHGKRYGTLKSTIDDAIAAGTDLLLDIDIRGALNFRTQRPQHTIVTFVTTPSAGELRQRLIKRGGIDPQELEIRLATAQREYADVMQLARERLGLDYFVVNDDLERAYDTVRAILRAERTRFARWSESEVSAICNRNFTS